MSFLKKFEVMNAITGETENIVENQVVSKKNNETKEEVIVISNETSTRVDPTENKTKEENTSSGSQTTIVHNEERGYNEIVRDLNSLIDKTRNETKQKTNSVSGTSTGSNSNSGTSTNNSSNGNSVTSSKQTYHGYGVDGKIEMPVVNLSYPVLEQMTDARAIDYAVAVQCGVGLNKVGNTVIVGHNYRAGLHFGSNKKMNVGDSIFITDVETGKRIEYQIYDKFDTKESDTSYYNRDTNGYREVSLVTCRANNAYRLVILAREVK